MPPSSHPVHPSRPALLHCLFAALPWLAVAALVPLLLAGALLPSGVSPVPAVAALVLLTTAGSFLMRRHPGAGRIAPVAVLVATAAASTVWGDPAILAAPPVALAVLAFAPVTLVAAAWGTVPVVLVGAGLAAPMIVHGDPYAGALGIHLLVVAAIAGRGLRWWSAQSDRLHRVLTDVALVDATTGLGNLRSLRRDFVRYKALAQRGGRPLLLSRWLPSLPAGAAWEDPRPLTEFVHVLEETTRQSDALYSLGHFEFVGLHVDLDSAAAPAARLRAIYPRTRVTWVHVEEGSALESLLAEVRVEEAESEPVAPVPVVN